MMKHILFIILASALLFAGCDTTSTSELLDGDFLPADTTPPNILTPADGEQVIDANLETDAVEVVLGWTAKSRAEYYTVEVYSDDAMTAHIPGSPFTVPAPETSKTIVVPYAGDFRWKVRASVTAAGDYSDDRSFKAWENCLYVYFPYNPADPGAMPDDSEEAGRDGTLNNPYQSINRAMAEAKNLGIKKVRVATRGRVTPTPLAGLPQFAAYEEYFSFKDGVSLYGGYLYQKPEGGTPSMTRAADFPDNLEDNPYETRLEGAYNRNIQISEIYAQTTIEGFSIRTDKDIALKINLCGRDLTVRNCYISVRGSSADVILDISGADSRIIENYITHSTTITTITGNDFEFGGIFISSGKPIIMSNTIIENEINSQFPVAGIINYGECILINNTIISGTNNNSDPSSYSYGICNAGDIHPLILNNTIISDDVNIDRSIGLYNNSASPVLIGNVIVGGITGVSNYSDTPSIPVIVNNTIVARDTASSTGMGNLGSAIPIAVNNIFTSVDPDGCPGVSGSGETDDKNYYYNCIYGNGSTDYIGISLVTGNVSEDPLLDSADNYNLTASSPPNLKYGGYDVYNDPDNLFSSDPEDANYLPQLDDYLTDIDGVARTTSWPTGSDPDNGGSGWSMGAYEY